MDGSFPGERNGRPVGREDEVPPPVPRPVSTPHFSHHNVQEATRRNFTLLPKKKSDLFRPIRSELPAKVYRSGPVMGPPRLDPLTAAELQMLDGEESRKPGDVSLRTKLSSHLHVWKRRGETRSPIGDHVVKPTVEPLIELRETQQTTGQERTGEEKHGMACTHIGPSMQQREAQNTLMVDEPVQIHQEQEESTTTRLENLNPAIFGKKGDHVPTDHAWIQDVMQNITEKGKEILSDSACTPTTATTGSDRQVSGSSQSSTCINTPNTFDTEIQTIAVSDERALRNISNGHHGSQRNLTPSSLPNVDSPEDANLIDTTPIECSLPTRTDSGKLLASISPGLRRKEQMRALYSMSPTITCTPEESARRA